MKHLKSILFLIIGIAVGFSFCKLSGSDTGPLPPAKPVADVAVRTLEKKIQEKEKAFMQKTDSLNIQERMLSLQLKTTKSALAGARKKNLILQTQVYDLLDKTASQSAGSPLSSAPCDSLAVRVSQLIASDNEKDSLCENITLHLEEQLSNRDSVIRLHEQQHQFLQSAAESSLLQQQTLLTQNKQYRRQFKRQRFRQKILSLGVIILSGLTANMLLHQ